MEAAARQKTKQYVVAASLFTAPRKSNVAAIILRTTVPRVGNAAAMTDPVSGNVTAHETGEKVIVAEEPATLARQRCLDIPPRCCHDHEG